MKLNINKQNFINEYNPEAITPEIIDQLKLIYSKSGRKSTKRSSSSENSDCNKS